MPKSSSPSFAQGLTQGLALLSLTLPLSLMAAPNPATEATTKANDAVLDSLDFSDKQSFDDARRGFIAELPNAEVLNEDGKPAWSARPYAFLKDEEAPATVNPSLWRQARLNSIHGLFEAADGIYQVRGMDLSNMTIVEGDDGLIIIDPLLTPGTAKAGLALYRKHRSDKPVVAVIYTHSHADHFAGVKGVISQDDVDQGRVKVYAPDGFLENAVSENVIAGNAMTRRAAYMYGVALPIDPRGYVDTGLGKGLSQGARTLIAPTDVITENGTREIAGVPIEFHLAPGSEAPAEMMMYFPEQRVFNTAEVTSQHMHNVYTLRGTEIRDASLWSRYIDEVLEDYGDRTDVLIAQHHWPVWGTEESKHFLGVQRDLYKHIHDQSVRLMNHGYRPGEIAENITLPASLAKEWSARDYYGTLRHNSRAVYQKYLGWYDANPANLNPPTAVDEARKSIEYMGGINQVIERARQDYAEGNYRWVATVMSKAVFAEPKNQEARNLAADAMEQLGYQAESGPWRDVYLSAAQDLRGSAKPATGTSTGNEDMLQGLTTGMVFDLFGVRLNGPKAEGKHIVLNWAFTDTNERIRTNLENATLTWLPDRQSADAAATVFLTRSTLNDILLRKITFPEAVKGGEITVDGDQAKLFELLGLLDQFKPDFPLIEPRDTAQR
ncbi:Alkyl sulfatase BDS1, metallo-beta-lactamase superfamily [Halopseudomonas xinjiangensis]|uniref:Alkyl sulfatase BDS1, metallo-beta-lactamase superfamily n=1 Tax=Halopseudomonas xinjiangensis TaxID=487184 RepID=A0A1H1T0B7_9GAMM|nr:alkyl sulfatase dimerization domain-containing protein [Halopseudomonas xinjiangensis]SDS53611.1 Alkyl sulfatase BDS1, metallo-beta-lactamase superfamily [Halopseudomonas xinjiangensis]